MKTLAKLQRFAAAIALLAFCAGVACQPAAAGSSSGNSPSVSRGVSSVATTSANGLMSSSDKSKLNALPNAWVTVSVPSDTTDVVLFTGRSGNTDGGYEIDYESAPTSQTSTQLSLQLAIDGGAAGDSGCTTVTTFGNGSVTGSTAQTRCDILTASSVATSQTQNARIVIEAASTTFPRTYLAFGVRLTPSATTNIANWWTSGVYQASGDVTGLTMHASTSNGLKAGSLIRYRVTN